MAHIYAACVRETSDIVGTGNIVLTGAMHRSLAFNQVMLAAGNTCDIVTSYDGAFEECTATWNSSGELVRTTITKSLHANGAIDVNPVSWAPGEKTVIMTIRSDRLAAINGAVRYDIVQSLADADRSRALANLIPPGTPFLFPGVTTAPVGFTKVITHNDKTLRIVSGTAGSGGSVDFSALFGRTNVDSMTLDTSQIPAITPDGLVSAPGIAVNDFRFGLLNAVTTGAQQYLTQGGSSLGIVAAASAPIFTGASFGGGLGHAHGLDMRVKYVDAIIATKD